MSRGLTALAALALLAGCATSTAEKKEGVAVSSNQKKPEKKLEELGPLPPLPRSSGPTEPGKAQARPGPKEKPKIVSYSARFDIDRLPGGKMFQGSILYLGDGSTLVASYRPMKQYFHLVDQRVAVKGFHWSPPAHAQQIMASHFTITEMSLDPKASPFYATKPIQLPAPPAVRTGKELAARDGRWVRVIGTLRGGSKPKNEAWGTAELTLADGALAYASVYWSTYELEWKPLVGQDVTITGKAGVKEEGGKKRLLVVGRTAVCKGVVERCGM